MTQHNSSVRRIIATRRGGAVIRLIAVVASRGAARPPSRNAHPATACRSTTVRTLPLDGRALLRILSATSRW